MARVALLLFWLASQAILARDETAAEIPLPVWFLPGQSGQGNPAFVAAGGEYSAEFYPSRVRYQGRGLSLEMDFLGTSAAPILTGAEPQPARVNFFTAERRQTDIQPFGSIYYTGLYPGIQAHYTGSEGRLKYEFIVAPRSDPALIRLRYRGLRQIAIEPDESLSITTAAGTWVEAPPVCYQVTADGRTPVPCRYVLHGPDTIGFSPGAYDKSLPLWIDPVLSFSTLLGNSGNSAATAVATDTSGNAYVAGYSDASSLGGVTSARASTGGVDAVVVKISAASQQIVYVAYIGGSADDRAFGIQADSSGNAYLTGWTTSDNFPTASAYQSAKRGYKDAFVAKLNPAGTSLLFSTYFGGSGAESGNGIALNSSGAAIVGDTDSTDMPVLSAYKTTNSGRQDAFVAFFSTTGSLTRASYFGGAGDEQGRTITLLSGTAYAIGGSTDSSNLPITGALQSTLRGSKDGFVAKFTSATLNFSTYFGGSGGSAVFPESVESITADSSGNLYLGGITPSADFPVASALYPTYGGGDADGFLAKVSATGSQLLVSTFIGGKGRDAVASVALAADGTVSVAGSTASSNLPVLLPLITSYRGGIDGFIFKFESTLTTLAFGSYLGGTGADAATAVAFTPGGDLWAAGQSSSLDFPTASPVQAAAGATLRFFLSRIVFQPKPRPVSVTPSAASGLSQSFNLQITHPVDAAQITGVQLLFASGWNPSIACFVQFLPGTNQLSLSNDAGTVWSSATPESAATLDNSQCTLKAATSSSSRSGTNLTLIVDLTFKPAFKGVREIWSTAWDASTTSNPVQLGAYTVIGSQPPSIASVAPTGATGAGSVFAIAVTDPNGSRDVTGVQMIVNSILDGSHACFLYYLRDAGSVALADDLVSVWSPVRFGSSDTAQNSQCVLSGMGSSVTESGNVLTLSLNLSFKPGFVGLRNIYLNAWDRDGLSTGTVQATTYQVAIGTNQPPVPAAVSPAAGAGRGDVYTVVVNDPDGATDISGVQILINTNFTSFGGCLIYHQRGSGILALANDGQTAWYSVRLGTTDTAENSQCSISGSQATATSSGTALTLKIPISFKSTFAGAQRFFVTAWDWANSTSGPVETGRYTVNDPPALVSVTPSAGSGTSDSFQAKFSDPNGGADIQAALLLFNKGESATGGCLVYYERGYSRLYLLDDAGTTFAGVAPNSSEAAENSKCTLKGTASSFTISGNLLTIQANVAFKSGATGAQTIYAAAVDTAGAVLSLAKAGTYNVAGSNSAPSTSSISPSSGSGASLALTVNLADGDGASDVAGAQILISPTLSLANACLISYSPATSSFSVANDSLTGWTDARLGTSDVAENSACSLAASGSSATSTGSSLKLVLKLTFKSGFSGKKSVYVNVWDQKGATSGFVLKGSWTIP